MLNRQGTTTCVVYKSGRILFMEDYNKYYFLSMNRILIFMFTGLYIGFYFYMIGFYQYNVGFYISIFTRVVGFYSWKITTNTIFYP
jgi:hypothetical protein